MLNRLTFQMKKNNTKFLSLSILLATMLSVQILNAQYIEPYAISPSNGDKMLEIKNYQEGVRQFTALLAKEPENVEYKFKLARSYNNSNIDKRKGLELLKELETLNEKPEGYKEELAIAYFKNYEFDLAKNLFMQLASSSVDEVQKKVYTNWVKQAERSKKMLENPVWIAYENLGKNVNSKAPDYLPVVAPDESALIYSTKRNGVVGNLYDFKGYKPSDINSVRHKRNKYSKSRSVGSPNTYGNEHTAGRSENGQYIIYNVNSDEHYNDLYVSEMGRRSYMPPKIFDSEEVNQKSNELGGTLSNDGQVFYFCSDREGGLGGYDIYMVKRLPNMKWSFPKNVGAPINTPGDENYPCLMDEGKTLYYSSNGHPGMGGRDLFRSRINDSGKWGSPENLGYPINTTDDDLNISYAKNQRYAYIAAKRDDSFGDLDIYRISFLEKKDNFTLLSGRVMNADSTHLTVDVLVEIFNKEDEEIVGSYKMNKKTGKYSAILPAGKYRLEVSSITGYKDFSKELTILGKNDFKPNRKFDIVMQTE